jgi:hypothetical protein
MNLKEKLFKDYIQNPHSIEGNTLNSSPKELVFRAPLGGEMYTSPISIHPKVTGSWEPTSSFLSDGNNFHFDSTPTFIPNLEYRFIDQPNVGVKTLINDKIRLESNNIPGGNTLSPFRSINNQPLTFKYTQDINYLEVAFSPQNEINDDIDAQLGNFNIGELIGDPILRNSYLTSYPELDKLRNEYFLKYIKNYNLTDYIRLIKYFDNSLFKMVKDFIPARTSLASGIVIKQHKLERNRYPHHNLSFTEETISGSLEIGKISGGTGGSFENFNNINTTPYGEEGNGPENIFNITQSWDNIFPSPLGDVISSHTTQDEFYNGEFSGSHIQVTQQNINPGCDPFKKIDPKGVPYLGIRFYSSSLSGDTYNINNFLNPNNSPTRGYMSIWLETPPPPPSPLIPIFNNNF